MHYDNNKDSVRQQYNDVTRPQKKVLKPRTVSKKGLKDAVRRLETNSTTEEKAWEGLPHSRSNLNVRERHKLGANKFENEQEQNLNTALGKRSIFYDPDWNLDGKAPEGFRNVPFNQKTFKRRTQPITRLAGLDNIVIPDFCLK